MWLCDEHISTSWYGSCRRFGYVWNHLRLKSWNLLVVKYKRNQIVLLLGRLHRFHVFFLFFHSLFFKCFFLFFMFFFLFFLMFFFMFFMFFSCFFCSWFRINIPFREGTKALSTKVSVGCMSHNNGINTYFEFFRGNRRIH